jgi:hypothetical protein
MDQGFGIRNQGERREEGEGVERRGKAGDRA